MKNTTLLRNILSGTSLAALMLLASLPAVGADDDNSSTKRGSRKRGADSASDRPTNKKQATSSSSSSSSEESLLSRRAIRETEFSGRLNDEAYQAILKAFHDIYNSFSSSREAPFLLGEASTLPTTSAERARHITAIVNSNQGISAEKYTRMIGAISPFF